MERPYRKAVGLLVLDTRVHGTERNYGRRRQAAASWRRWPDETTEDHGVIEALGPDRDRQSMLATMILVGLQRLVVASSSHGGGWKRPISRGLRPPETLDSSAPATARTEQ